MVKYINGFRNEEELFLEIKMYVGPGYNSVERAKSNMLDEYEPEARKIFKITIEEVKE